MKNIARSLKVRIGLLVLLTAFTGFYIRNQFLQVQAERSSPERNIPPEGKPAEIDTGGTVPGNPDNAVRDMRELHKAINTYQNKHGQFPQSTDSLWQDMQANPQDYGFRDMREAWTILVNPDSRYSDNPSERERPDWAASYGIFRKRPDGTLIGTPKAPGTRDVLIYTATYYHANTRHFPAERSKSNPVGFFIVMWEDGQIEKIPYDRQLYVPKDKNSWNLGFPGQAGISGALTYDQFHQRLGMKRGPKGKAGGKGESYQQLKK